MANFPKRKGYDICDFEFTARICGRWAYDANKKKHDGTSVACVEIPCVCNPSTHYSDYKVNFKLVAWGDFATRFAQMNPIVGDGIHCHAEYMVYDGFDKNTQRKVYRPYFQAISRIRLDSMAKREATDKDIPLPETEMDLELGDFDV